MNRKLNFVTVCYERTFLLKYSKRSKNVSITMFFLEKQLFVKAECDTFCHRFQKVWLQTFNGFHPSHPRARTFYHHVLRIINFFLLPPLMSFRCWKVAMRRARDWIRGTVRTCGGVQYTKSLFFIEVAERRNSSTLQPKFWEMKVHDDVRYYCARHTL